MYIKQIIIQGFKSYKDQTVIEPFSPKHNVIVGRNGSGKSNFFAALRFVLNDSYQSMGREERAALLHEGAGAAVMSAYVEVIFDNSDERFPTGTEEVVLRRTIGTKKDEYSLNRKNATKQEIMNMLESAGFSKSNPYYIVPQGRVTTITNMKDAERLNMLKTVAGTNVYEERRAESLRIMGDTENKRSKIDSALTGIKGKLDELEEEKQELRAFQEKDRERRCLEYTVHRQAQEAAEAALQRLEGDREHGMERYDEHRHVLEQTEIQLETIDANINELKQLLASLHEEKSQLDDERLTVAKAKAKVELDVKSMTESQASVHHERQQYAADLQNTRLQIKQCEAKLAQIVPTYDGKLEQEKKVRQHVQESDAQRQRLYAKQNRAAQFKSKRERDQHLQKEISDINILLAKRKAVALETTEQISHLESLISQLDATIGEMRNRIMNRGEDQQKLISEVQAAKEEKDRLMDRRKEVWREHSKVVRSTENASEELRTADQKLGQMMDHQTRRGIDSVRRLVRTHKIPGVHGLLGELCEFNEVYKTAVDVTAGTSLFHYVVDNEATASRLVDLLKREKGGKVTFVPLSQVRPKTYNVPTDGQVVHLIKKLKFNPEYEKAFQQVFAKTLVCPNLQVATQYARSHGMTGITQDGDLADSKGPITGGFFDTRKSRTDGLKRAAKARAEYEKLVNRRSELERETESLDQLITRAMSDLQKAEQRRMQLEGGFSHLPEEIRRKEAELHSKQDELANLQRQRDHLASNVHMMMDQLTAFQSEMSSDFKTAPSNNDERELQALELQLPELRQQHRSVEVELSKLRNEKVTLELQLKDFLRPMLDNLLAKEGEAGEGVDGDQGNGRAKELQRDLKRLTKALDAVDKRLNEIEAAIDQTQQDLVNVQRELSKKQEDIRTLNEQIRAYQRSAEKTAAKRAALNQKVLEAQTKIGNLGALPENAFSSHFTKMNSNVAESRLHKVTEALKKYGKVNKKAFEQFAQFERQQEVLENRRAELNSSDASIRELIDVLDQRKDEAIERTFRQVSREFATIFKRLVPAGKGRLIIQRRSDRQARGEAGESDSEDDNARANGPSGVESYTGVGISVSFNSEHDEQQRIQQLSGGQKSLCALALVFAIQASDPAPFYLFDEIDANLDAQYRTAVAQLLQESSQTGQFICTTFRPEMLYVAEKCYGVSYAKKTSSIGVVTQEEALDFIEGQINGGK